jgi:hypothetical protein
MKKNLVFSMVENVLLILCTEESATDEEFREVCNALGAMDFERGRTLIITAGGGPTITQRNELSRMAKGRTMKSAVVSDAPAVRGIVTAVSWINRSLKAFPTRALEDAFRYIDLPPAKFAAMRAEMATLQVQFDDAPRMRAARG